MSEFFSKDFLDVTFTREMMREYMMRQTAEQEERKELNRSPSDYVKILCSDNSHQKIIKEPQEQNMKLEESME